VPDELASTIGDYFARVCGCLFLFIIHFVFQKEEKRRQTKKRRALKQEVD